MSENSDLRSVLISTIREYMGSGNSFQDSLEAVSDYIESMLDDIDESEIPFISPHMHIIESTLTGLDMNVNWNYDQAYKQIVDHYPNFDKMNNEEAEVVVNDYAQWMES